MMTVFSVCALLLLAAVAFVVGAVCGACGERAVWTSRALPGNSTPHHCDGEFYYVIPESVFCREYTRRRPTVGPKGGTGTPPKP